MKFRMSTRKPTAGGKGRLVLASLVSILISVAGCAVQSTASKNILMPGIAAQLSVVTSRLAGVTIIQVGAHNDVPKAIRSLPDGSTLIAGISYEKSLVDMFIAKVDRNGVLVKSFGEQGIVLSPVGSGNDRVNAVAFDKEGRIVLVGARHNSVDLDFALWRYEIDGALDTSFGQGGTLRVAFADGNDEARGLDIQSDGRMVVIGSGHAGDGEVGVAVTRLDASGNLDTTFGGTGKVVVVAPGLANGGYRVRLDAAGKIYVAGSSEVSGDVELLRLLPDGNLDSTFGVSGRWTASRGEGAEIPSALALASDGKILLASSVFREGKRLVDLLRLTDAGQLDSSFGSDGKAAGSTLATLNEIAVRADGKILVVGSYYQSASTRSDFSLEQYLDNGQLDPSFGKLGRVISAVSEDNDSINTVLLQPNGATIAVGVISESNLGLALARYGEDGALDTLFGRESFL